MSVRYPHITIDLTTIDGNAFVIMGAVTRAMKQVGADPDDITKFRVECIHGDYDQMLETCARWVNVV